LVEVRHNKNVNTHCNVGNTHYSNVASAGEVQAFTVLHRVCRSLRPSYYFISGKTERISIKFRIEGLY